MDRYADLKNAFGSNLAAAERHWFKDGIIEGRDRTCNQVIDEEKVRVAEEARLNAVAAAEEAQLKARAAADALEREIRMAAE